MKILVSAFACSPLWGSEPSVGWNWALELSRRHEVTVLTHAFFRGHIEPLADEPVRGPAIRLGFDYLDVAPHQGPFHEQLLNSRAYYLRWQRAARARVLSLLAQQPFDLVHHVTWGNFRWPVPLHGLSVPLVVGPLGGGERAPSSLYATLPWRLRLKERVRDAVIASGRFDPWLRRGLHDARWVLCRTAQTIAALPAPARARAVVAHDIGAPEAVDAAELPAPADARAGHLRCLFVGRMLAWKGAHFALRAVRVLRDRGVDATLTMVGSGELEPHLRDLADRLALAPHLRWLSGLPREQVMRLYGQHDVFLFPSLHDSGGTVVLESLSCGLPVVCVDLGGPPHFVDAQCGRVVRASDGDADALPGRLADALQPLAADPALRSQLRHGALRQARAHAWPRRVGDAYAPIERALAAASQPTAPGAVPRPVRGA